MLLGKVQAQDRRNFPRADICVCARSMRTSRSVALKVLIVRHAVVPRFALNL